MTPWIRGRLLRKVLLALLLAVGLPLGAYSVVNSVFVWRQHRTTLAEVQQLQAQAAAQRISQFVREIEGQLQWATHLGWSDDPGALEQRRLDAMRLLRQAPAVTDLRLLDGQGRERVVVSRLALNQVETGADRSAEPGFRQAMAGQAHHGPVTFRRETEPFMQLAVAGTRREAGVVMADVNLKHIWDVVAHIRVGQAGRAWVVDRAGLLIAHPDISLVLRNTDLSARLPPAVPDAPAGSALRAPISLISPSGERVLASWATAEPMDWRVFVEVPEAEAQAPLREALWQAGVVGAGSLLFAALLASGLSWRMVRPIRELTAGAARIGGGQLDHRISIHTDDELQALGDGFNAMAAALEASRSGLEGQVAQRTHELAEANRAKSRLLAAASHDLRQPLHALNLLVAQLPLARDAAERERLTRRIEAAVASINGLFDGLLDISKLEAGVVTAHVEPVALQAVFDGLVATYADAAQSKGLRLRVRPSRDWVLSDRALLERILGNLLANAVRYTAHGGIVVGARRRGSDLRLEVWDSGIGIRHEVQPEVFREFFQVAPQGRLRGEGLGLGLAIVSRLCALLGHPIGLASRPGRGSCFNVSVPWVEAPAQRLPAGAAASIADGVLHGRRVVVIDNDHRVLDSTGGLLATWGCEVVAASSLEQALLGLGGAAPDLVIADLHLDHGALGTEAIAQMRRRYGAALPAFLLSGDVSQQARDQVAATGLALIDKPASPLRLRTLATRLISRADRIQAPRAEAGAAATPSPSG